MNSSLVPGLPVTTYILHTSTALRALAPRPSVEQTCAQAIFKRPARDACLCMGDLQAPAAPHFVFLITL